MAEITEVLHGTTVATNAILEGKGARVGLVTTKDFRQVLQIARSFVPGGLAGWIIWPKPEPLAAHERRVAEIAAEVLPGLSVSISSSVLPELREYERTLTTVANATVQPRVARYVANL